MKRTQVAAGALVLAALASACGSSSSSSSTANFGTCSVTGKAGSIKLKPVKAGVLIVQTALPAPGWFNGDDPASIKDGYEYCMAAEIAQRAGLKKVEVVNVDFDQLVSAGTKNFDLALAEISITDKRKQVVDFSVPYFASDIGILAKKDAKIASTADLKNYKLGVQKGTTGADFITAKVAPDAKVFESAADMFSALDAGAIDVAFTDTSIVQEQEKKSAGAEKVVGQYKTGESYGALYPKGSANKTAIDGAITAMIAEKVTNALATKYLSGDPSGPPFFTA